MVTESLRNYIEDSILPLYDGFDAAHRRDHVDMVIEQSLEMAAEYGLDEDMAYVVASYHDVGMLYGRELHHLHSGKFLREDLWLKDWLDPEQVEIAAQAVEDHRASSGAEPRSIYGKVVAEADRFIDADTVVTRTIQFGLANYPELSHEEHWQRACAHLVEKYGDSGYLRLWFADSPNAKRLEELRCLIRNKPLLKAKFEAKYRELVSGNASKYKLSAVNLWKI
ncbi:MAG: HD domain-containing protein [Bacteroidales bacterium]|nr:HD domain-containing protein [Bacteroidales bacterium]